MARLDLHLLAAASALFVLSQTSSARAELPAAGPPSPNQSASPSAASHEEAPMLPGQILRVLDALAVIGVAWMYTRSLRFMLEDPHSAALCLAITRARERLEGQPALVELNARMHEWTTELVRYGREVGAVRTDVPADLMVQVGLSMMDAGDRWLATRLPDMKPEDVDPTARMMVNLLRRVSGVEKKRRR